MNLIKLAIKIGAAVAVGKLTYMVLDTINKTIVFTITGVILAGESKYRKENEKVVEYPYRSSWKAYEEKMKKEKSHESDNNRS
jgi:hypothetical protein